MRQLVTWHLVRERGAIGLVLGSLPSALAQKMVWPTFR